MDKEIQLITDLMKLVEEYEALVKEQKQLIEKYELLHN